MENQMSPPSLQTPASWPNNYLNQINLLGLIHA